jgi:anti-anti-sigma factor
MAAVESELIGPQWGLDLREAVVDGQPVVYVSGSIHSFNAHMLSGLLLAYGRHEQLTIDLSGVHRFGPAAFNALVAGARQLAHAGCALVLQNPSRTVKAVLGISGAEGQFEITETSADSPSSD